MGLNHAVAFAALGVTKTGRYQAPPSAFTIPEKGHYLYDPHSPEDPPAWLVDSIDEHGLIVDLVVKREGDKLMVDGRWMRSAPSPRAVAPCRSCASSTPATAATSKGSTPRSCG